ncbi:MAG: class I SAM-dependent methyltransferase [Vicinamibacteria bacterium]
MSPPDAAPRGNAYRERVLRLVHRVIAPHLPVRRALDFGAGDGWFARRMLAAGSAAEVVAVDTMLRRNPHFPVELYDGTRLPYADRSFDLAYCVDVLHHCDDPPARLADLLRCTSHYFLIKDHTEDGPTGRFVLSVLDEIGNRRFGVPSPHRYQRGWEWDSIIEDAGFRLETLVHPAPCQGAPLGWLTNRMQFVGLWRRIPPGAPVDARPLLGRAAE